MPISKLPAYLILFVFFLVNAPLEGQVIHPLTIPAKNKKPIVGLNTSISGDFVFALDPNPYSSSQRFLYLRGPGKFSQIHVGEIKWFHFSRNGYLYLREEQELIIKDEKKQVLLTFGKADFKKYKIKNIRPLASSKDYLFFLSGSKTVLKVPLRDAYVPVFDEMISIPYRSSIIHYQLGVDDENNLYGVAKYTGSETSSIKGNFHAVINKIEDDGSVEERINYKTLLGVRRISGKRVFDYRHVAFLPDGRFLLKLNTKHAMIVSNDGKEVKDYGECSDCHYLKSSTKLDGTGRFLTLSNESSERNQIFAFLPEELLDGEGALKQSLNALKLNLNYTAYQLSDLAIKKGNKHADAYLVRGITRPNYDYNANLTFKPRDNSFKAQRNRFMAALSGGEVQVEKRRQELEKLIVSDLNIAVNLKTNHLDKAYHELAMINFANAKFNVAQYYFKKARAHKNQDPNILAHIIEMGIRGGKGREVLPIIDTVIQQYPKKLSGYFFKGAVYYLEKDYEKAKEFFEQAYSVQKNPFSAYHVGLVYAKLGDQNSACRYFTKSLTRKYTESHYFMYQNCGNEGVQFTCKACSGGGVVLDPVRRGVGEAPLKVTCGRCNGYGYLVGEPDPHDLEIIYR